MLHTVPPVTFDHIFREHNKLADSLSKKALNLEMGKGYFTETWDDMVIGEGYFTLFWWSHLSSILLALYMLISAWVLFGNMLFLCLYFLWLSASCFAAPLDCMFAGNLRYIPFSDLVRPGMMRKPAYDQALYWLSFDWADWFCHNSLLLFGWGLFYVQSKACILYKMSFWF